jgi:hypothetical protein
MRLFFHPAHAWLLCGVRTADGSRFASYKGWNRLKFAHREGRTGAGGAELEELEEVVKAERASRQARLFLLWGAM